MNHRRFSVFPFRAALSALLFFFVLLLAGAYRPEEQESNAALNAPETRLARMLGDGIGEFEQIEWNAAATGNPLWLIRLSSK